tara:strand:+ start:1268 stop:2365 length:1098 start_codon:yes stop_codon:yes gene_type:complete
MVYKTGKLKGELTTSEIRKLIRAHNILMSIKIPPKTDREGIFKILDDNGYMVNHVRQSIQRRNKNTRKPNVTLDQAEKIIPKRKPRVKKEDAPKPKFKIDKSKQPKQTPSKVDIKIKPESNTKKIESKKKEVNFVEIKKKLKDEFGPIQGYQGFDPQERPLGRMTVVNNGKNLRVKTSMKDVDELIKFVNDKFKKNPLVYDNVIFVTDTYLNFGAQGEQDGVVRKIKLVFKGEVIESDKKLGRPIGSKTILNFSKFKAPELEKLFDSLGVTNSTSTRRVSTLADKRRFLKSLIEGEDFSNLKSEITVAERKALPYHLKAFYGPKVSEVNGVAKIQTTLDPKFKNFTKKMLVDKINKFVEEQKNEV